MRAQIHARMHAYIYIYDLWKNHYINYSGISSFFRHSMLACMRTYMLACML
jgi:hypothetical protein